MKQILKMLAPYFAVLIFWCVFSNAWLAILVYHAQILLWSRKSLPVRLMPDSKRIIFLASLAVAAGPLLYFLLPYIMRTDIFAWLESYKLSRLSFILMIPYFGILHPLLEQIHWAQLRESTAVSHFMFAGYHMLVLYSLLTIPWLIFSFVVLVTASFLWKRMVMDTNSLFSPVLSHILADLGIILVVWLKM